MALTPQTINPAYGSKHTTKRVGRGNSSQKGNQSARGGKGQTARSGGQKGNKLRSLKRTLQQVPKLRGFKSQVPKKETVALSSLIRITKAGDVVTPQLLKKKGIIGTTDCGVKIVGVGVLSHAITVKGCFASKSVTETIEKAGGTLVF